MKTLKLPTLVVIACLLAAHLFISVAAQDVKPEEPAEEAPYCKEGWENLCLDSIDWHPLGVVFEIILLAYAFLGLAIVCDEYLVPSLETLCVRWNVREDVAGASFMAFGSAAPEIIINAVTTIQGAENVEIGIGAIIGSGMIAFLVIPSLCILMSGQAAPLQIKRRPLARDILFYGTALLMLCVFFSDGKIILVEAVLLVVLYVAYLLVVFLSPNIRKWYKLRQLVGEDARAQYISQRSMSFVEKVAASRAESRRQSRSSSRSMSFQPLMSDTDALIGSNTSDDLGGVIDFSNLNRNSPSYNSFGTMRPGSLSRKDSESDLSLPPGTPAGGGRYIAMNKIDSSSSTSSSSGLSKHNTNSPSSSSSSSLTAAQTASSLRRSGSGSGSGLKRGSLLTHMRANSLANLFNVKEEQHHDEEDPTAGSGAYVPPSLTLAAPAKDAPDAADAGDEAGTDAKANSAEGADSAVSKKPKSSSDSEEDEPVTPAPATAAAAGGGKKSEPQEEDEVEEEEDARQVSARPSRAIPISGVAVGVGKTKPSSRARDVDEIKTKPQQPQGKASSPKKTTPSTAIPISNKKNDDAAADADDDDANASASASSTKNRSSSFDGEDYRYKDTGEVDERDDEERLKDSEILPVGTENDQHLVPDGVLACRKTNKHKQHGAAAAAAAAAANGATAGALVAVAGQGSVQSVNGADAASVAALEGGVVEHQADADDDDEEEDDETPTTYLGWFISTITIPLKFLFSVTCPKAALKSPWERWYPLGFLISFLWVACFSLIIGAVVGQWVELSKVPKAFFGLILVALGAEIPDMIQSVTVARRGYGSMAVSNCLGSQITNILVGLGFSWMLSVAATGNPIVIKDHRVLFGAAMIQMFNVFLLFVLMLGIAVIRGNNKAMLSRWKGKLNLVVYFAGIVVFAIIVFVVERK